MFDHERAFFDLLRSEVAILKQNNAKAHREACLSNIIRLFYAHQKIKINFENQYQLTHLEIIFAGLSLVTKATHPKAYSLITTKGTLSNYENRLREKMESPTKSVALCKLVAADVINFNSLL